MGKIRNLKLFLDKKKDALKYKSHSQQDNDNEPKKVKYIFDSVFPNDEIAEEVIQYLHKKR